MSLRTFVNFSEKHKCFSITQPRTASRNLTRILKLYDFDTYLLNKGELIFVHPNPTHNHTTELMNNHLDYDIILSCRNPYSYFSNGFRIQQLKKDLLISTYDLKDEYYEYMSEIIFKTSTYLWQKGYESEGIPSLLNRTIKYRIKVENFEESLMKVPFISNSDPEKISEVSKFCNEKLGKTMPSDNILWREFFPEDFRLYYNQRNADLIYENYESMFKVMDYHKDSWML